MADKEKVVKKKKVKKEEGDAAPPADVEAAPPSARSSLRQSTKSSSKKAVKRSGSNVFSMFSTQQVAEFKEGFALMDNDKDGILGKNDLRATWDKVGKCVTDKELDEMLAEGTGPINFTQMLSLFANKMAGGADDDKTVRDAFMTFDDNGKINGERLKHALVTWGDKFSGKELGDAFEAIDTDGAGNIDTEGLIQMLTASQEEEP